MKPASFPTALLVEDELNLATTLKVALGKIGIAVEHVTTIDAAHKALKIASPSLIVLDRTLPDGDGLNLCEAIRLTYTGMILMLTARGDVNDRVSGLNAGADDYLPKPFSWAELDARISALYRRRTLPEQSSAQEALFWQIDSNRLRILRPSNGGSEWVTLTPLEFKLASHLISAKGAIVTREDL